MARLLCALESPTSSEATVRSVAKAAVALVGLLLVAAIAFLVPPHLQVRGVEPDLPSEAALRALLSVDDGPSSVRYVATSEQALPRGRLGHTTILVEWANGKLFMIDAGMDRAAAAEFGELMETALGAGPAVSHGNIAELLGDDARRVSGVAFTHLHIDHVQGLNSLCEARGAGASVYQTSWQAELHNFNTEEGAEIVEDSCLEAGTLSGASVMTIEGFPGLGVVALGGHTPGSTLFAIADNDRLWLLSGDTTNTLTDLLTNTGKGFLYSSLLVPENTARTAALRGWLAGLDSNEDMTVVVSHDLDALEAFPMTRYEVRTR
jgi:glyoxylase-like metal-dependent hydrolase (beta-lactamase superfamily II)